MIKCSFCGKELEHVPQWLSGVNTMVVCNNCPARDLKSITEIKLEPQEPAGTSKEDMIGDDVMPEEDEEED